MTLRGILTAQLPLQARWTCEARLARSFAASALARIPLSATSDNASPLTPFQAFFYLQVTADIRRHLFVSQELPGKTMVRLPKPLREKEFRMSLLKNAKSRIVTVTAPLFLGFVMPWFLQANRGIRGEAQFKLDPSAMLASTVAEVLAAIAFVVVFIASLLYFAKQSDARKLLLLAGVVSLIAFIAFTLTYSLYIHGSVYGWIYYALFQMFPGLILVVGYITAAIAAPLIKPSSRN